MTDKPWNVFCIRPSLSGHPALSGHSRNPQGWPLNTGSTHGSTVYINKNPTFKIMGRL